MNRKSFFKTLTAGLFAGTIVGKAEESAQKDNHVVADSLVLKNANGESFKLGVNEAGDLIIRQVSDVEFTPCIKIQNNKNSYLNNFLKWDKR